MTNVTPLRARRDPPAADAELLVRVAKQDLGALGELFDRHASEVRAFAARLVGPTDADDVVQETFVRVSRLATGFDGRASARAWLFGVAYHVVRERRRSFARLREALRRFGESGEASPAGRAPEIGADILRALDKLDEPKRAVILLAEVHGLTGAEIAEALDEPVGTVWARLHRARAELRETLSGGRS